MRLEKLLLRVNSRKSNAARESELNPNSPSIDGHFLMTYLRPNLHLRERMDIHPLTQHY